jgi:hypothetical protein
MATKTGGRHPRIWLLDPKRIPGCAASFRRLVVALWWVTGGINGPHGEQNLLAHNGTWEPQEAM